MIHPSARSRVTPSSRRASRRACRPTTASGSRGAGARTASSRPGRAGPTRRSASSVISWRSASCGSRNRNVADIAVTLAERGAGSTSDISPKNSPADSVANVCGAAVDRDLARQDQEQRVAEAALDDDRLAGVVALDLAGARDPLELLGRRGGRAADDAPAGSGSARRSQYRANGRRARRVRDLLRCAMRVAVACALVLALTATARTRRASIAATSRSRPRAWRCRPRRSPASTTRASSRRTRAGCRSLRGTELALALELEDPDVATSAGQGFGAFLAHRGRRRAPAAVRARPRPRVAAPVARRSSSRIRASRSGSRSASRRRSGAAPASASSWHHFSDDGVLDGVDTFDLGFSSRWGNHLAIGATLRDVATRPIGGRAGAAALRARGRCCARSAPIGSRSRSAAGSARPGSTSTAGRGCPRGVAPRRVRRTR